MKNTETDSQVAASKTLEIDRFFKKEAEEAKPLILWVPRGWPSEPLIAPALEKLP